MLRIGRVANLIDGSVAIWLLLALGLDALGGRPPPGGGFDAVVVPGAGVRPGGHPSTNLRLRTRRAVDLWWEGQAPRLALTGGEGDWPPAESEVARRLAVGWGVPDHVLVLEARSRNTEENARELHALLGDARILVVTDRYHVLRCQRVFGRYFDEVHAVGVRAPWGLRAHGALREVLALAWYAARGNL